MKYLVTGGAGYIGSHIVFQLLESGHEVVVLDDLCTGHRWAVPAEVEFVEGDVGDSARVDQLLSQHRFDGVMHLAASLEVRESISDPLKYYRNNTVATLNLADACVRFGISNFIFSSTAAVYGDPSTGLIAEDDPLNPVTPYGASKLMSERILQDVAVAAAGALRIVRLRYFNVAGAREDLRIGQGGRQSYHLIKVASEAALGVRPSLSIHGTDYPTKDGTCLRDYVHVEDVASAHLAALKYLEEGGVSEVFNLGYGRPYSVRDVIQAMKSVSGVDFQVIEGPRRPGDPAQVAANSERAQKVLGWAPQFDDLSLICKTALGWESIFQSKYKGRIR